MLDVGLAFDTGSSEEHADLGLDEVQPDMAGAGHDAIVKFPNFRADHFSVGGTGKLGDQSNVWCPRLTAAMMRSGSAFQTKGLGSVMWSLTKRLIAA